MRFQQREILGVQFISFARLARDTEDWSRNLPRDFCAIAGLPRSGLTVAHMVACHLNLPARQLNADHFRQATGRQMRVAEGPVLVVDDCCSYGNAINAARQHIMDARFAAVYARPVGIRNCQLDYWHKRHADPDWLVLCEWNWCHHQDTPYVSVTDDVLFAGQTDLLWSSASFHRVYCLASDDRRACSWQQRTNSPSSPLVNVPDLATLATEYVNSSSPLLVVRGATVAEELSRVTRKPVLDADRFELFDESPSAWVG